MISVIIPAHNEAALIGGCLEALLASDPCPGPVEVVVVANGCEDRTAEVSATFGEAAHARGWAFQVLEQPALGKVGALNAGDDAASHPMRAYLDADVTVSPKLLPGIMTVLDKPQPAYASGQVRITATGRVSRRYARFWARVPFMSRGVPGCGIFAVNAAGRTRWDRFPPIISDDTYVRLLFRPEERHLVPASYDWPIAEGHAALVRVRKRQDVGVAEIARDYPQLLANDDKDRISFSGLLWLMISDPIGFLTYADIARAVRRAPDPDGWSRGR